MSDTIMPIVAGILVIFCVICLTYIIITYEPETKETCETKEGMLWTKGSMSGIWQCMRFSIDNYCYSYPEDCPIKYGKYKDDLK